MSKLLFIPFSVIGGILAGTLSKKAFHAIWGLIDEREAPQPQHRDVPKGKLVAALVLEGAISRAARGLSDHGTRHAFQKLTGTWPGEERAEPA